MSILHDMGVYRFRNFVNEREYIGSTGQSFIKRWQEHIRLLRSGQHINRELQADWDRHGSGAFAFEIIESVKTVLDAREQERFWIRQTAKVIGARIYNRCALPSGDDDQQEASSRPVYSIEDIDFLTSGDAVIGDVSSWDVVVVPSGPAKPRIDERREIVKNMRRQRLPNGRASMSQDAIRAALAAMGIEIAQDVLVRWCQEADEG